MLFNMEYDSEGIKISRRKGMCHLVKNSLKETIEYYGNGYWKYLETVLEFYSVRLCAWYRTPN